jgi:hypothetical protein
MRLKKSLGAVEESEKAQWAAAWAECVAVHEN